MLGIASLLRVPCLFFLKVAAVRKKQRTQLGGGGSAYDLAAKAIAHQRGNIARMVEMCMRQQHRVDGFGRHRECRAIAITQLLVALKETAIDEDAVSLAFNQIPRSSYGSGGAEELKRRRGMLFHVALQAVGKSPRVLIRQYSRKRREAQPSQAPAAVA